MSLNRKVFWLAAIPALALFATGCGGFTASKSFSPASFFLPGLLQSEPPPALPEPSLPAVKDAPEVAQS